MIINNNDNNNIEEMEILGEKYVRFGYLRDNLNLTSDRLLKWRNGRGAAKNHFLKTIRVGNYYFYKLSDIMVLKEATAI